MARVEALGTHQLGRRALFHDEFDVVQLLAKLAWQSVDKSRHFFADLVVIQWL